MHWIRRHRKESAAYAAVVVGVLMILVFAFINLSFDDSGEAQADPLDSASLNAPSFATAETPEATPLPSATVPIEPTGQQLLNSDARGLLGTGRSMPPSKHAVTLRVTSSAPIDFVNYYVPSANQAHVDYNVGTSWSRSMTGRGNPAYAMMFLQANGAGTPITCTITVDGKVTERRSTEGPYGQIICVG